MALSSNELQQIHLRKLATPNKKYYGDDDKVYIGTSDRRLKLFNSSDNITHERVTNTVKDELDSINNRIDNNNIVEVDFGGVPGGNYTEYLVENVLVKNNSMIILKVPSLATEDHNAIEHSIIPINLTYGDIVESSSFKIKAFTEYRITGKINIQYIII